MGSERRDLDSAAEGLELEQTVANIASAFFASESLGLQRAIEDVEQDIRAVELRLEQERQEIRSVEQGLRQEIKAVEQKIEQRERKLFVWLTLLFAVFSILIALEIHFLR